MRRFRDHAGRQGGGFLQRVEHRDVEPGVAGRLNAMVLLECYLISVAVEAAAAAVTLDKAETAVEAARVRVRKYFLSNFTSGVLIGGAIVAVLACIFTIASDEVSDSCGVLFCSFVSLGTLSLLCETAANFRFFVRKQGLQEISLLVLAQRKTFSKSFTPLPLLQLKSSFHDQYSELRKTYCTITEDAPLNDPEALSSNNVNTFRVAAMLSYSPCQIFSIITIVASNLPAAFGLISGSFQRVILLISMVSLCILASGKWALVRATTRQRRQFPWEPRHRSWEGNTSNYLQICSIIFLWVSITAVTFVPPLDWGVSDYMSGK